MNLSISIELSDKDAEAYKGLTTKELKTAFNVAKLAANLASPLVRSLPQFPVILAALSPSDQMALMNLIRAVQALVV